MQDLALEPTQGLVEIDGQEIVAGAAPASLGLQDQLKQMTAKLLVSPRSRQWMLFGVGLLVGWIVLGWVLFPIKWTNTDPWDMRGTHQERYVLMLAEYYWQTEDLAFVLESVNGWERDELDQLTADLVADKDSTPEQRVQLAALGEALRLPMHESSLLASMLGNSAGLLVAVVLALIPLLGGVGLVVMLVLRQMQAPSVEDELAQMEDELAAGGGRELAQDDIWAEKGEEDDEDDEDEDDEEEAGSGLAAMAAATEGVDEEISDMLSTFFDDDDQSLETLQALTKGLNEVNVDYMLRTMQGMVQLFQLIPPEK